MASITEKVDEIFSEWDRPDSPGCALAVVKGGEVVYKRGYGMANLEYAVPITPRTIFHVASVSKQFTDFAIAILADEGRLSIDDEVRAHVPELPDFGEAITIRHLVHHTSGIRDQWELLVAAGWRMDDVITTDDVLELVSRQRELNFKPGSEYLYCNTGYTLMAVIVERVTSSSLREFCTERIFGPLGMRDTHFHDDHREIVRGRAYSYAPREGGGFQHSVLSYATVGATSLFTTVEDLVRWDQNFYDAKVGGRAAVNLVQTRGVLNDGEQLRYAFGLNIGEYRGLRVVEHSGADAGYRSHLIRFPGQHFSVAILCNLGTMIPSELTRRVADVYIANDFPEERNVEKFIELPEEQVASRAGIYYNASTSSTRRLEFKDGRLIFPMRAGIELLPVAEDRYKPANYPMEVSFPRPEEGERIHLRLVMGDNKPVVYEAVEPMKLTTEEQFAYTGNYYSPELEVSYEVGLEGDQLVLRRRKYGSVPLMPTTPDGFAAEGCDLLFHRDERGGIAGLRLSSGRIRHLLFTRVAAPQGGG
jgi:CubicO group peptidase (beta-lactamase class C family)